MPGGYGLAIMSSEIGDVLRQLNFVQIGDLGKEVNIYKTFGMEISNYAEGVYPIRFGEFCSLWAVTQRWDED